jgi:hypothetical protein
MAPEGSETLLSKRVKARKNEERFAGANAQIEAKAASLKHDGEIPFLCECSDLRCRMTIRLSLARYRAVRAHEGAFMLLAGHEDAHVERTVSEADGFVLVEKYL